MKTNVRILRRTTYAVLAVAMLVVGILPAVRPGKAYAAQLQSRSITMSDSGPSNNSTITTGVGSGTNVTYKVGFTTSATAESVVIDFCKEDPIINDTCNAPGTGTGHDMNAAAAAITAVTGNIGGAGWTVTASAHQVKLANDANPAHDATAGSQVFDLTGITNPDSTGSFYARIYTYTNNSWGTYSGPTSIGNYVDYGGIALSTNQIITITARVQETLTFCVSGHVQTLWTTHDCSATDAAYTPALTLGHGSPTPILDSSAVDTGTVYSQLSTNATNGAVIAMRNSNTTCGGLSANGGTTCAIPANSAVVGNPSATAAYPITAGTAAFGMYVAPSTDDTNGTGSDTPSATYYNASHVTVPTDIYYGMNAAAVDGTFGDTVATASAPCYRVDNAYTFGATAALTTPAGIYTANMDLIATGTF